MPDIAITQRFESIVNSGEGDPNALARAAKQGDMQAAADLAALLARAGFRMTRVVPTISTISLVEARPEA